MNVENILDNIATSVIITNKYMEIVHVNASGENFLRNSKEKLLNKKINLYLLLQVLRLKKK